LKVLLVSHGHHVRAVKLPMLKTLNFPILRAKA
jgi:hypothetical protein